MQKPGKRQPACLSLNPIFTFLNGWHIAFCGKSAATTGDSLSTASAKQDFRSDAATASGTSVLGTFQNCGRRQRMSGHRTEADIVRADFPLSARPASRPLRTAGLS
jgi:hypothetical protein